MRNKIEHKHTLIHSGGRERESEREGRREGRERKRDIRRDRE